MPDSRARHAWLADGTSLFDRFGFDFTLLDLAGDPARTAPLVEAARTAGLPLTRVAPGDPALRDLYEADCALIRPPRQLRGEGTIAGMRLSWWVLCRGRGARKAVCFNPLLIRHFDRPEGAEKSFRYDESDGAPRGKDMGIIYLTMRDLFS